MSIDQSEYYGVYSDKLDECKSLMVAEIGRIAKQFKEDTGTRPVEHILARVKSGDSVKEKLVRYGFPLGVESALTNLSDVVACRVVTHFVGEIYDVLEEFKKSDVWHVESVKDYIKNSKSNGYRSLHVLLRIPFGVCGIESILAEIQMRTIAMDCWAALEHQLKYKKEIDDVDLITNELKRCADEMASTDISMETIRQLINQ